MTMEPDTARQFINRTNLDDARLTEHLTLGEAKSCMIPGIVNFPGTLHRQNIIRLAKEVYEPLIECFDDIFTVLGMYRCRAYCIATGKRIPNQYMLGEVLELTVKDSSAVPNSEVFTHIFHWLPYDQLIWCTPFPEEEPCTEPEPAWIYVSLKKTNNRHIALREYWEDGVLKTKRVFR